ncbi:MAG: hypothetical protein IPK74_36140 [Deltaproteobacteria bacterium]|nr:hypothetical protein [Deltaproteobacteria bacterium]
MRGVPRRARVVRAARAVATFGAVVHSLVVALAACGPEREPPLADGSWVVGHYLRAACSMTGGRPDSIEGCWNRHYYAVEFTAEGDVVTQDYACFELYELGVTARWRATTDDGVIEVVPLEGEADLKLTSRTVVSVEVHRTNDCLAADVFETDIPGRVQRPYLLLRGEFIYEPSIEGCEPKAMYVEPPTCPEPADPDG